MATYRKTELTPAKKKFAQVVAQTDNATEAVRQAYPDMARTTTPEVLRNKASRLLTNANVSKEIEYQKNKLEQLASKAVDRVEQLIQSDNEAVATQNIWRTIEQVQGKATQRIEQHTTGVQFSIDLSQAVIELEQLDTA
jgi:phage terminase small subunit